MISMMPAESQPWSNHARLKMLGYRLGNEDLGIRNSFGHDDNHSPGRNVRSKLLLVSPAMGHDSNVEWGIVFAKYLARGGEIIDIWKMSHVLEDVNSIAKIVRSPVLRVVFLKKRHNPRSI